MDARAIIALRAPQWSGDPRLSDLITLAGTQTGSRLFRVGKGQEALALRVLHWLALEAQMGGDPGIGTNSGSNSAGVIASEREYELSRSYHNILDKCYSAALSSTPFGMELQALAQGSIIAVITRAPGWRR